MIHKKIKLLIAFSLFCGSINKIVAQQVLDSISLDVLVAPNSPAFNLLGISPTLIDKPSTPTDFAFSVANASNNFSQLPKNYAIEILPVPLLFSKSKAAKDLYGKGFANTFAQTFSISSAFTTNDTISINVPGYIKTRTGIGFKVSLLRGEIDTTFEEYKTSLIEVRKKLNDLHAANIKELEKVRKTDLVYLLLQEKEQLINTERIRIANDTSIKLEEKTKMFAQQDSLIDALKKSREDRLEELKVNQIAKEKNVLETAAVLKTQIEAIKFRRYGPMLDMAGAVAIGYRNDDFQNSIVQQYAFWLNGGYSIKQGFDFLALARYNNNVKAIVDSTGKYSNQTSFDIGGKIEFVSKDKKFSLAGEAIARFVTDTSIYRYTFNTSYQVKKNQAITLSVGKNFGSTKAVPGGNLIATLNYIIAFGSNRKIYE